MPRRSTQSGRSKPKNAVDPSGFPCSFPGCTGAGDYKAPLSPTELNQHRWFCLDHVREYNANWDYFDGMGGDEIESFMKDAMLGHRPTWKINSRRLDSNDELEAALHNFMHGGSARAKTSWRSPKEAKRSEKERKALAVLNLEGEVTLQEVKKQYKLLVKKYHPDVNTGNKRAEERFKRVTQAYQELLKLMGGKKGA